MQIDSLILVAVGALVCASCVGMVNSRRLEKKHRSQMSELEQIKEQLQDTKETLQRHQLSLNAVIEALPKNTAKYFPTIAAVFVAIEHPEDDSKIQFIHEKLKDLKNPDVQEQIKAAGNFDDITYSRFNLWILNALIHSINEPDAIACFKSRLREGALSTYSFDDEDKQQLQELLLKFRGIDWLSEYQQFIDAFEQIVLEADKT